MSDAAGSRPGLRRKVWALCFFAAGFIMATLTWFTLNPRPIPAPAKSTPSAKSTAYGPHLSPDPPQDIPLPATPAAVDDFAWRLFVALNWPVLPVQRGIPDESRRIGDPGVTVWRSFKTSGEVFTPGGEDPGPWTAGGLNPSLHLDQEAKATRRELELSEVKQAIGGPLTDQRGNLTYYDKAANVISYDFIRQNKLYNMEGQARYGPVTFPFGSIEVKAAWRIMTGSDHKDRYYTMPATVLVSGTEIEATVGLAGLHIITKTPNAPAWIWSTFEQVDNVPGSSSSSSGVPWSYNNPASSAPPNRETAPGAPTQVERYNKDLPGVINAQWQNALKGTPWQYYQLIGTQYPAQNPRPDQLANVVMETYIQPGSSCIDCHSAGKTLTKANSDFSFLLLDAASAKPSRP